MNPSTSSISSGHSGSSDTLGLGSHAKESKYAGIPESEVWKDFKNGSEEAFVYIYELYFSTLFNYAHRFSQNREAVKDHIQDMFIDLRRTKKRLSDTDSIKFYLFSSIRRRILKAESKNLFFLNTEDYQNYDFEITISPEQMLINSQMDEKLKSQLIENISKLSGRQKEAIMHYYYEGFSYEQVSKLMGFSKVKYARILVYRALKKLKESFQSTEFLGLFLASICYF
ncbi:MAG: sigma-70 family RNA polymerase sigma factor [Cyclobacteriaceae bacterium]